MSFVNLGSLVTKKEGTGAYIRIKKDSFQGLAQAVKAASAQGSDLFLNIDLFTNNLKKAMASGKLEVSRTEKHQEVVNKKESNPEQAFVLADLSVALKD